jgi:hypothetical protein
MSEEKNQIELFDLESEFDLFDLAEPEKPKAKGQKEDESEKPQVKGQKKGKKKKNSCEAPIKAGSSNTPSTKPQEPDNDMERFVVLTNDNEQMTFPAEMSLEDIRAELEKEYPAYTQQNTNWHWEKQEDKNRYLCIPSYKSNKLG